MFHIFFISLFSHGNDYILVYHSPARLLFPHSFFAALTSGSKPPPLIQLQPHLLSGQNHPRPFPQAPTPPRSPTLASPRVAPMGSAGPLGPWESELLATYLGARAGSPPTDRWTLQSLEGLLPPHSHLSTPCLGETQHWLEFLLPNAFCPLTCNFPS